MDKQKTLIAVCLFLIWSTIHISYKHSEAEDEILLLKSSLDSLRIKNDVLSSDLNVEKMINIRYEYALEILETIDSLAAYKYRIALTGNTE
jgi:hypothetical protein